MPYKFGKALLFSLVVWIIGLVWGSTIFMSSWKDLSPIPFVSSNPVISFPLLVLMPLASFLLARVYLKEAENAVLEGLKFGLTVSVVDIIMDFLVYALLLGAGLGFFVSLTLWINYVTMGVAPYCVGRAMAQRVSG